MKTYPFHFQINTRFTDTDMGGHLNNVSLLLYYQDGRARFMLDCFPELSSVTDWSPQLVRCDVTYDGQTYYPDPIDVASGVSEIGDSWIRISQAIFQRGQCVGQCDSILAVVDSQGQSLAINPAQRARLSTCQLRS